jgi:hypothetical protein
LKPYVILVIVLAGAIWLMMDKLSEQAVKHRPTQIVSAHEAPREGVGGVMTPVTPQPGLADEQSKAKIWDVNEITAHFDDNEVTAESLFWPQTFFEGTIDSVETYAISGALLTVRATVSRASLLCNVDPEDMSALAALHRGQTAVFVGSSARRLGTVFFEHCKFVNPAS